MSELSNAALTREVRQLRRTIWLFAAIALVSLVGAAWSLRQTRNPTPQTMRLADPSGRVRATLSMTKRGARFEVIDEHGIARVALDESGLSLLGNDEPVAYFAVGEDGNPALGLHQIGNKRNVARLEVSGVGSSLALWSEGTRLHLDALGETSSLQLGVPSVDKATGSIRLQTRKESADMLNMGGGSALEMLTAAELAKVEIQANNPAIMLNGEVVLPSSSK